MSLNEIRPEHKTTVRILFYLSFMHLNSISPFWPQFDSF